MTNTEKKSPSVSTLDPVEESIGENYNVVDAYHQNEKGDFIMHNGLKAGISTKSANLIALCGIIGPGALIGFGSFLKASGPVGMIVGFAIISLIAIPMMFMIGEMNSTYDSNFTTLAARFISRGFGATVALCYVILWITNIIAEYTSLTASLTTYSSVVPTYGWYLIMWAFFTVFQLLDVSWWAETEFYLGIIKLLFLSGFYLFSIIYAAGGIKGHSPGNPFKDFPLNSGFKGIASGFIYGGTFMSGIESVSVIATETRDIKKAVPNAVKNTVIRILYVYFGLSISYGITVPYNNDLLNSSDKVMKSPMYIALAEAGWANSKYYVTTIILVICVSSINTAIYLASRSLFTWAEEGYGPKIFAKTTKRGVPYVAIHTCHLFGFLSILSYSAGSTVAYSYIVNVTGVAAFIIWTSICVIHLRFRKLWLESGRSLQELSYISPLYPWLNYFAILIGIVLILVQSWTVFKPFDYKGFIDGYIMIPVFIFSWVFYDVLYFKSPRLIKLEEIDFEEGTRPALK